MVTAYISANAANWHLYLPCLAPLGGIERATCDLGTRGSIRLNDGSTGAGTGNGGVDGTGRGTALVPSASPSAKTLTDGRFGF